MGGDTDSPHRSSSPLKRPASDLEQEAPAKEQGDVHMDGSQPGGATDDSKQNADATQAWEPQLEENTDQDTDATLAGDDEFRAEIPPIDEQISRVKQLHDEFAAQPLTPGMRTYIVSNTWLDHVQAHGSGAKVSSKDAEVPVGPVDNSDLIQESLIDQNGQPFARLKPDVVAGSFSYFPEEAWDLFTQWYGIKENQPPIVRQAVDTSMDPSIPNLQFELHPVVFVIHRLWAANSPIPISQVLKARMPPAPIFVVSRNDRFQDFLRNIKRAAGVEVSRLVRLWSIPQSFGVVPSTGSGTANATSPPASRENTPAPETDWSKLLIEANAFHALPIGSQREVLDAKDFTNDPKYNGKSSIDMTGLGKDQGLALDEHVEKHLFLSSYLQKVGKQGGKNSPASAANAKKTPVASKANSARSSTRSSSASPVPMLRGRPQRPGKTVGTVGLTNLGNTCYMNSALQCIRSVEELTKYFLAGDATNELNTENPLGQGGHMAIVYNSLLHELYKDPPAASMTPRQFKNAFGRFFGSFSGYGQQDSQEFLGIMLDALQEDLNRVKKKPYIEKPDSTDEMVHNKDELRKMADQVWEITKRRDDSVIGDLFTGMYKSTLVCPACSKVSITFDPFSTVTLQLPLENTWSHEVCYYPLNDKPIRIVVDMDKHGSIKTLKEFISSRVEVSSDRLFVAEEFRSQLYRIIEDMKPVSEEIQANDNIMVFELESAPTNWPPVEKQKQKPRSMLSLSNFSDSDDDVPSWDSPLAQRLLVPVISRHPNANPGRFGKPFAFAPVPFFIVLTPEEARSEEIIKRKILERVANLTTYDFNQSESDDKASTGSADQDIAVTTASDAASGDGRVVASSIDGEDFVDVSMNKPSEASTQPSATEPNPRKRKFHSKRPKWIDPEQHLPGELQDMFELSYFGSREIVPAGWNIVNEDRRFPRLSTRAPAVRQAEADDEEDKSAAPKPSEPDESSEEDGTPPLAPTRMNDESSDDESPNRKTLPVRPVHQRPGVGINRFRKGQKTYTRKTTGAAPQGSEEPEENDGAPLVRLGEGIIVDWQREPFEALFLGDRDDSMRGHKTYGDGAPVPLLPDPALDAKRQARQRRRREGISLAECLDEFGKEEILSEMDTWYCPRCKEHRRASKKLELWKTPDILVFHLKRFSSSLYRRDKLDVLVDFPIKDLDMSTRVLERSDGKKEIYDLFAVDNHYGSLYGGHYTAYAKSFVDQEWYDYNDSSVSKLKDASQVISSAAYLLFYRRRSDVPLGGPRFKEIIERLDNPTASAESESADSQHSSPSSSTGGDTARPGGSAAGANVHDRRVSADEIEQPPDYKAALADDTAPLLEHDEEMNDGIQKHGMAEDEAIDVGSAPNRMRNVFQTSPPWDFSGSRTANSDDGRSESGGARSDDVQFNSSASEASMAGRLADFDAAEPVDYEEERPVPDMTQEQMDVQVQVPPGKTREEDAEEAAEIHVEEGEGVH